MAAEDQPDPDAPAGGTDVSAKLFGTWEVGELEYADPSTERYITVTPVAHTAGRHATPTSSSRSPRSRSSSASSTA